MSFSECQNLLDKMIIELGFSQWGYQQLKKPMSFAHYQTWLDKNYHGDMNYLKEHAPLKAEPNTIRKNIKSSFIFSFPYVEKVPGKEDFPIKSSRIALYAKGYDYHYFLKEKLSSITTKLGEIFPGEEFLNITDSFPLMERDLAAQSGLGWFGKNTCLIHPKKGSLFLLCEILTSLDFITESNPLPDFCGKCTKCIDICPTQAIESEKVLNATRCISYWTIESRKTAPPELRSQFGDWLFGCDLCQTVCPWNQKIYKNLLNTDLFISHTEDSIKLLEEELVFILTASGKKITEWTKGTPLSRAGSFGLKRNALIVIANRKMQNLKPLVEKYLNHEKLGDLADWTLKNLVS